MGCSRESSFLIVDFIGVTVIVTVFYRAQSRTLRYMASLKCEPAAAESCEFDEVEFDMEILADLNELENIMETLHGGETDELCSQDGTRKSSRLKGKAHKAVTARTNLRFEPEFKSQLKSAYPLLESQPSSSEAPTYVSQIDELFKYRLLRHAVINHPQRSLPDSIYNFTQSMINCLNSSDTEGLSDLLRSSMDTECALGLYCFNAMMSPRAFLEFLNLLNVIHPDRILRISNTSTVKNRISTSVLLKFTDCRVLFNSAAANDPSIVSMFHSRSEHFKRRLCIAEAEPRQQMAQMIESEADLVIYGNLQFNLTFDVVTHKATGLYISGGLTSAHPAAVTITHA